MNMNETEALFQALKRRELLLREARSEARHSNALSDLMDAVYQHDSIEQGLSKALEVCANAISADAWLLLKSNATELRTYVSNKSDLNGIFLQGAEVFLAQPRRVTSLSRTPIFHILPDQLNIYASLLSEPIRVPNEPLFVVLFLSLKSASFSRFDAHLLRASGKILQRAIEGRQLTHRNAVLANALSKTPTEFPSKSTFLDSSFEALSHAYAWIAHLQGKIIDLTNELLRSPSKDVAIALEAAFVETGKLINASHAFLFFREKSNTYNRTLSWSATQGLSPNYAEVELLAGVISSRLWLDKRDQSTRIFGTSSFFELGEEIERLMKRHSILNFISVPLVSENVIIGALCFGISDKNRIILPSEVQLLQAVSNAISIVSERAEAEIKADSAFTELVCERNRMHATLAAIPDLVVEMNQNHQFTNIVAGGGVFTSYPIDDLLGKTPHEVFSPNDIILFLGLIEIVEECERTEGHEYQLQLDGHDRLFTISAAITRIADVTKGYVFVVRDITHQALQERQLRRLGKIAETTSNLVLIADKHQKIEWVNEAFERQTGWGIEEVRGRDARDFVRSDQVRVGIDIISLENLLVKPARSEFQKKRRNGEDYWVTQDFQHLLDMSGKIEGFIAVQTDITALKRSQQSVIRDRAKALDASLDGIAITDGEGRYKYMNSAHRRMFGISEHFDISKVRWQDLYSSEQIASFMDRYWPILQKTGHWNGELTGYDNVGNSVPQEVSLTKHDGGILCISRNISERLRLENERIRLREELQMAQRRDTIAHLASGVAHDLNNLVAVVAGSASLLKEMCTHHNEAQAGISRILRATDAARDLVNGLGFLGRPKAERRHHDLRELLRDGLELLGTQRRHENNVVAVLPAAPCFVWGNITEILQVIVNLALNACDAASNCPNKVRLVIEEGETLPNAAPELGELRAGSDYVVFSVSDTGTGIDSKARAHLFDRYFSTKDHSGGGLGLPIVSGIVRDNDAVLWLNSVEGEGTTVSVAWPKNESPHRSKLTTSMPQPKGFNLSGHNILVVDDQPDVADIISEILENLGATVISISNAKEARSMIIKNPGIWSALVTDQDMPDFSGADLARVARTIKPPVPSILVTALPEVSHEEQSLFAYLVPKPIDAQRLISSVCAAILSSE